MSKPPVGHIDASPAHAPAPDTVVPLAPWEILVCDAVGNVIEFWGFKRNQGRVWALLYLRDAALSATELQELLGLSKGAVSMITRELEQWSVVSRVRRPGDAAWRFAANTELLSMVNRVLESRELGFIARVCADLESAERAARQDPAASDAVVERVVKMRRLADLVEHSLRVFLRTSRLDVSALIDVLQSRVRRSRRS
jgi:DNA-binding transcriptional regulator GbsR (MarR family)